MIGPKIEFYEVVVEEDGEFSYSHGFYRTIPAAEAGREAHEAYLAEQYEFVEPEDRPKAIIYFRNFED